MSGKNKQQTNEKEEKKSKANGHPGVTLVIGERREAQEKLENRPEQTAGNKEHPRSEEIKAKLEEKTKEALELFDKWIRLQAEFENYKKRIQREKSEQMKFGNEALLKAFLPVLDNLERAIGHGKGVREAEALLAGVEITQKQFLNTLEQFGVKPVRALGEVFDPEKHEAVSQMESDLEPNRVASEVQRGYTFYERLLRPAKVIVSKSKIGAEEKAKAEA